MPAATLPSVTDSQERKRNVQIGLRLRDARIAAGLSQPKAATALKVHLSTIHRWEKGEIKPREHWADVCRVYRVSRVSIEFPEAVDSSADADPPWEAWGLFLDWLETAPERSITDDAMVAWLRGLRFTDESEPSIDTYKHFLHGLFATKTST